MEEYIEAKDQAEWITEEKHELIIQGFRFDNFIKPNSEKGEIMKVLVIPDVHLKPYMFDDASGLMRRGVVEKAVCLMDIADDWGQEANLNLYEKTFDKAIQFAKEFPDTLWCYGNHDYSYLYLYRESGFSYFAIDTVRNKLAELQKALPDEKQLTIIHRIDKVLFMHGGLTKQFVYDNVPVKDEDSIDDIIERINQLPHHKLWEDNSPLWARPQEENVQMYLPDDYVQVVGHSPVRNIYKEGGVISCDVFSTYRDGRPIGTGVFPIIDTETGKYTIHTWAIGTND